MNGASSSAHGASCRELSVVNLCQLSGDTPVEQGCGFAVLGSVFYFLSSATLYAADFRFEGSRGVALRDGFAAIAALDSDRQTLLALLHNGDVQVLQCSVEGVEELYSLELPVFSATREDLLLRQGNMVYDSERQLLLVSRDDRLSIHNLYESNNRWEQTCIADVQMEGAHLAVWGAGSIAVVACILASDISTLILEFEPAANKWRLALPEGGVPGTQQLRVLSKHHCWVSALSHCPSACDVAASGDSAGTLIVWRCFPPHRTLGSSGEESAEARPVRSLIKDRDLSGGHKITAITIDMPASSLWVGDASGAITGAQIMLKSRSLRPTRRLTLFGVLGGASHIEWMPCTPGGDGGEQGAQRGWGYLRSFCPSSGMLVECSMYESVESIFRVWPSPVITGAVEPLTSESSGRVDVSAVATYGAAVVETCALLPRLNMVVVAGASRHLQVWNLESGALALSVPMEDSFCRCIAAYDGLGGGGGVSGEESPSEAFFLAAGYSSGKFVMVKCSRRARKPEWSAGDEADEGDGQQGGPAHSVRGVDILDAINQQREFSGKAGGLRADVEDDDSVVSEASLSLKGDQGDQQTDAPFGSDEDPVGSPGKHRRGGFKASIELSAALGPLAVTDLFFSDLGEFCAVCQLRRVITVYSGLKVSLKVRFEEMFLDIQPLVTQLTHPDFSKESQSERGDSTVGASATASGSAGPTVPVAQDSLLLLLHSATRVQVFDAVKGAVLREFRLDAIPSPAKCAAWMLSPRKKTGEDLSVAGFCVSQDFSIFHFGEPTSSHQLLLHRAASSARPAPSRLDSLVQGVAVRELSTFSPLATVWSLRRLALLRVQILKSKTAGVLRSQEYFVAPANVRIIHASALKSTPRIRKHRALVVLSQGVVIILSLSAEQKRDGTADAMLRRS